MKPLTYGIHLCEPQNLSCFPMNVVVMPCTMEKNRLIIMLGLKNNRLAGILLDSQESAKNQLKDGKYRLVDTCNTNKGTFVALSIKEITSKMYDLCLLVTKEFEMVTHLQYYGFSCEDVLPFAHPGSISIFKDPQCGPTSWNLKRTSFPKGYFGYHHFGFHRKSYPPEVQHSPWKVTFPKKERIVFQPSFFSGKLLNKLRGCRLKIIWLDTILSWIPWITYRSWCYLVVMSTSTCTHHVLWTQFHETHQGKKFKLSIFVVQPNSLHFLSTKVNPGKWSCLVMPWFFAMAILLHCLHTHRMHSV